MLSCDQIKDLVIPFAKSYGLKKVSLFGSYARNEQDKKSDVDLIRDSYGVV